MELPYTSAPIDAYMAAQTSVGIALSAVIWRRPLSNLASTVGLLVAIWLSIVAPIAPETLVSIGAKFTVEQRIPLLNLAAAIGTVAIALSRPRWLAIVALAGNLGLVWCGGHITDSDTEFAGLHLVWFAVLYALHWRANRPWERPREPTTSMPSRTKEDFVIFGAALTLALLVGYFIIERVCDSADEWAYQWQALALARFKAYAPVPKCETALASHWIFNHENRWFAMYMPGWPIFLAPFARAGVAWLASPIAFALMVLGIARVARRLGGDAAGRIAALAAGLGSSTLFNAASLYCHCFVAAGVIWTIEAVCATSAIDVTRRAQWLYGLVIGSGIGLAISTRPTDAAILGAGAFLVFAHGLVRRKIGWRVLVTATLSFALFTGLTLVILRLQLGVWFKTGYGIAEKYYWWTKIVMDVPARDAWKYGLPFMTVAYCFFPAAAALGAAGLVFAGRRISFMFALATVGHLAFYVACAFGRYRDYGYGPRYHLALVMPMAIGAGVLLAPLFKGLRAPRLSSIVHAEQGPAAMVVVAAVLGLLRIAPLLYSHAYHPPRSALARAIAREKPTHAVIVIPSGATAQGPLVSVQNDPFDPDPQVVLVSSDQAECVHEVYKDRVFYRASGIEEVTLTPY